MGTYVCVHRYEFCGPAVLEHILEYVVSERCYLFFSYQWSLDFKIYFIYLFFSNNPTKKWEEYLNRQFSKEDIQRAKNHMKRCSASLFIREMQIKTTLRHCLTLARTAIIKKSTNNKCLENVEKKESYYTVGGNVNWCNHCGKQYGDSSEY